MDRRLFFLREMTRRQEEFLTPQANVESLCGYWSREAQEAFETRPGDEIEYLENLADLGYLERRFHDRVRLCRACHSYALNFREICPRCESANVDVVQMLHHFRCGFIAPEPEFQDGVRLLCPKCSRPLRNIGIDYERPSSNFLCAACRHVFPDPLVTCQCFKCGMVFPVENAQIRTVYAYRLTASGVLAAAQGTISDNAGRRDLVDANLAVYTPQFFEERLAQDVLSAKRYKRALSIMLVSPYGFQEFQERQGREAAASLLKALLGVIKETLRECDVMALYRDGMFACLLPDTPAAGVARAADRILVRVATLAGETPSEGVSVALGLATLSETLASPRALLEHAEESLRDMERLRTQQAASAGQTAAAEH